jgi:hypothetical protein
LIFWHSSKDGRPEALGLKTVQNLVSNYATKVDRHLETLKKMVSDGEDSDKIEKFKITIDNNSITLDYWKTAEKVMKERQGI